MPNFTPAEDDGSLEQGRANFGPTLSRSPVYLEPRVQPDNWETDFAREHPNTYKAGKFFFDWFVPFGWAVTPSGREQFSRMDKGSQGASIALDALLTALLTPWGRAAGKAALKAPVKMLTKGPKKLKPFEDTLLQGMKPFDYEKSLKSALGKRGLHKDEITAVMEDDLLSHFNRAIAKKGELPKPVAPSKGLRKILTYEKGVPKIEKATMETLSQSELMAKHYQKQYQRIMSKELGQKYSPKIMDNIYEAHAKTYGIDTAAVNMADASPKVMYNLIDDIVTHPRTLRRLAGDLGAKGPWFPLLNPTRIVFGYMEKPFKAYSKIYEPISKASKRTFSAAFGHTLTWGKMLEQNGLAKVAHNVKTGAFKIKPGFSAEQSERAYAVLRQADDILGQARVTGDPKTVDQAVAAAQKLVEAEDLTTRAIVKTWYDFSNTLYAEHLKLKLPQVFDKFALTPAGKRGVNKLLAEANFPIDKALSTASKMNPGHRRVEVEKILESVKAGINHPMLEHGRHPWFRSQGDNLLKEIEQLTKDLSIGKGGNFVDFLENYVARVGQQGAVRTRQWGSALSPNMRAFYTKGRRAPTSEFQINDFGSMIEARIMAQAKEMNLYPVVAKVVDHAKGTPAQLAEFTNHFISRALNVPSVVDHKVARILERTLGGLEQTLLGRKGTWDARRVQNLAMTLNNFTHLGGLGFKPFSAVRNLFQPLVTVPADLGGLRDIAHLGMGAARAMKPETRAFIREIGAIQEYAPELYMKARALPFGRKALGVRLPRLDSVRDYGMWMFKQSDRWNRYVTGGAALNKWERALLKVPEVAKGQNIEKFVKASGIRGRHSWKREAITDMVRRGDLEGAKRSFVYDVIADTQFLYSPIESPLIAQKYGGLGKTGAIFQSWWMNYGSLLRKWLQGGQAPGLRASRTLTAFTSMAIAEQLMEAGFGRKKAAKIVYAGPFPVELNEFLIPPAWTPVYHSIGTIAALGSIPTTTEDWDKVERKVKATLGSTWIFVPGGLQMKSLIREVQEDGWEGLPKGILQYHQDPDFRFGGPLRDLVD